MFNRIAFLMICIVISLGANAQQLTSQQKAMAEAFLETASGTYNNHAQADTTQNPLLALSEIRAFRIWTDKPNEYSLSVGWYQPGFKQPMGEKIYHLTKATGDTLWFNCSSWNLTPDRIPGEQWKAKNPYAKLNKNDLADDGCGNYLVKDAKGNFVFKTVEGNICQFNNLMAPFNGLFFHFVYKDNKMDIYDRNYKDGKVIFHYENQPMLMRKVDAAQLEKIEAEKLAMQKAEEEDALLEEMRLKEGDNAYMFKTKDVLGRKVSLKKLLKKKEVLLVFLRHVWCPVCNYRTHELLENYEEMQKKGYEVIVIYESSAENLRPYVEDLKIPYYVISDEKLEIYKAYKVEFSMYKMQKSRQSKEMMEHFMAGKKMFGKKEYKKEAKEEKSLIIPADFVVDKNKKIKIPYYGSYIGDHYPVEDLPKITKKKLAAKEQSTSTFYGHM